jgi:predicted protein tyrosine phosphatase
MTTLSDNIRQARYGAVANPYQGSDKKVLFVCSMGILRSATGARLYAHKYNTRSAGTYDEALIQVTPMLIMWADEIVFVNQHNYDQLMEQMQDEGSDIYNILKNNSKVLNIPDQFEHMHPELIKAFEEQYEPLKENK